MKGICIFWIALWSAGLFGVEPITAAPLELELDFAATNGSVRAVHGVNLGPLCYRGTVDLTEYHRELKIPVTRLHDVVWVNAEAVDIHTIFRDPRNAPEDPTSYDFRATDDYVQGVLNTGAQIVYRLGESIEHTPRRYHVHPPADLAKWAAICLKIIEHYNSGWANGFHDQILYWEVWNEPDVRPSMWSGTDEDYFRLYQATATAIKSKFPDVKVGGPALGGSGDFVGDKFKPSPFLSRFLAFCREHEVPLDFFSWHHYTQNPWELPQRARAIRQLLDQSGYTNAESHLNEWNYLPNNDWTPMLRSGQGAARRAWYETIGGRAGAAFAACALMLLQDAPITAANYYTGEIQGFGLFDFYGQPKLTYYAFDAFRQLLDTSTRLTLAAPRSTNVVALAGLNSSLARAALLVSNFRGADTECRATLRHLPWSGPVRYRLRVVAEGKSLAEAGRGVVEPAAGVPFSLVSDSVVLLELQGNSGDAPQ